MLFGWVVLQSLAGKWVWNRAGLRSKCGQRNVHGISCLCELCLCQVVCVVIVCILLLAVVVQSPASRPQVLIMGFQGVIRFWNSLADFFSATANAALLTQTAFGWFDDRLDHLFWPEAHFFGQPTTTVGGQLFSCLHLP